MLNKTFLTCLLLGASCASYAQVKDLTTVPAEPNCGRFQTAPPGESTRDKAEVRAEGAAAGRAADTRSGAQCDNLPMPSSNGARSRAEVRAEGRQASTAPVEGGAAGTSSK